ncbi:hypothetical protein ACFX2K_023229 [Malus domestica]
MARDSETLTNGNSNVQGLGPRQSTRLNIIMSRAAPPARGTTVATTTTTTLGKAHDPTTTTQAMPFKPTRAHAQGETAQATQTRVEPNTLPSRALALHPRAPHTVQPTPVVQPVFVAFQAA